MRTLLLADDSVTIQRVIALTFAAEQISVITCGDGQQAMARMAAQRPDIVLAGTTLPQVSGYDLARFMRGDPELRDVPVLLLAGAFETVDDAKLKSSGANGIIEKPVEPNNVISRVKELLGLKSDAKPPTLGRLITSAETPEKKRPPIPTPPRAMTSTPGTPSKREQLREPTGREANTSPVEGASARSEDYLDTLDAAFDTLDQRLSGRAASAPPPRHPSGPLSQSSGAPDPRSPGRRPQNGADAPGDPVFEVDDEWFGAEDSQAPADARAGRRETQEDLRRPDLQAPAPEAPASAVFEIDDDWFAEDNLRVSKQIEHQELAAEMGIREVELPHAEPRPNAPALLSDLDFGFSLDDIKLEAAEPLPAVGEGLDAAPVPESVAPEPVSPVAALHVAPPPEPAPLAPVPAAPYAPVSVMPTSPIIPRPPLANPAAASASSPRHIARDFAQLLAFEQGEHHEPPTAAPPEISEAMLGDIVSRVTARLNTGAFLDQLRVAMTATVADTAREIATATSERLVREIATATSERLVRDIASATSERLARDIASETSNRVVREIATETSERIAREVAFASSERVIRGIAAETSERLVREIASDTSERLAREVAAETSERLVRGIVSETSERLVRDEIERIKSKSRT